jgi:4-hydroxybenzoate polyprenyltransferase
MVCARTAAMLFNRIADWTLDQRNPRTAARHRLLSRRAAIWLLIFSSAAFVASAGAINRMTLLLSPIALVIVFFYSTTKRFTAASHFFLGLALAVAPAGAWIAATGRLELAPLILGAGVIAWVAGFDLIYAIQDLEFDRREGLHSLAVRLGIPGSLRIAQYLHVVMFLALLGFGFAASLGRNYFVGMPLIAGALIYEHWSARRLDIAGINRAFFQSNAFVSAVFLVCAAAGAIQAPS